MTESTLTIPRRGSPYRYAASCTATAIRDAQAHAALLHMALTDLDNETERDALRLVAEGLDATLRRAADAIAATEDALPSADVVPIRDR